MEMLKASPRAARVLAKDVRDVDKMEWEIATGQPFLGHLLAGLLSKDAKNFSLWKGEHCHAVFGVQPYGVPGVGRAWFAGSNGLMHCVHEAHRHFEIGIEKLHEDYPTLIASSWHRNTVHHKWMERMGFTLMDAEVLGREQFLVFMRRHT